ncbi:hypothetical protein EDB84DRAFT_151709 [Lactarius hengduanensis]|nr:hypothetical protein EDB84DRAFT_151709 [Lactarius hengduanensis]
MTFLRVHSNECTASCMQRRINASRSVIDARIHGLNRFVRLTGSPVRGSDSVFASHTDLDPTSPVHLVLQTGRSWAMNGAKRCRSQSGNSYISLLECTLSHLFSHKRKGIQRANSPREPTSAQRVLISATILIAHPVIIVPPLYGVGFTYTPLPIRKPGIQGRLGRADLDSISTRMSFSPLRICNTAHNLHVICVRAAAGRFNRFNIFADFGVEISVALVARSLDGSSASGASIRVREGSDKCWRRGQWPEYAGTCDCMRGER